MGVRGTGIVNRSQLGRRYGASAAARPGVTLSKSDARKPRFTNDCLWPNSGLGSRPQSGQRRIADRPTGAERPHAAVRDFRIERRVSFGDPPFTGVMSKNDRRRKQSSACGSGNAPIYWQLPKNATVCSRPAAALCQPEKQALMPPWATGSPACRAPAGPGGSHGTSVTTATPSYEVK